MVKQIVRDDLISTEVDFFLGKIYCVKYNMIKGNFA